jgi:peptidoglycan/LPS O-acetylase OafA/YrhL
LAALYVSGLSRPGQIIWVILPLTGVFCVALDFAAVREFVSGILGSGVFYNAVLIQRLWLLFLLGIAAYILRHRLVLSGVALTVLMFVALMSQLTPFYIQVRALFVGYAVLYLGFHGGIKKVMSIEWPDYSYGIYIYAAPIMVLIHAAIPNLTAIPLTLLTVAAVLPVAALSWHFVERPALEFYRQRISRVHTRVRA